VLLHASLASNVFSKVLKPVCIKYTDHQSVFLNFLSSVEEKGKGFWKINNSILNDKDYTAVSLHASLASNVFSRVLVSSLVFFAFILLNVIVISLISTLSA
jgi:hypothetical protein